ncbi:hypothetical protein E0Z10_g4818 [Xylaria hypoxylon]|uniref:F-box domain-containing protein n=1 Tax=Xylaria hypoxylon TaxID=37992 RepID=A0A4Z0YZG6_9PEZI|nr:hypothetical protein E0Z10_g4818 [Xylaria hypoxylon]
MGMGEVIGSCTGPFRFCALPTEVRLHILESTDLLTPTREVSWNPITGYKVPFRGGKGSWRPPSALFVVSKVFYTEAQKVFFKHNRIVVRDHVSIIFPNLDTPVDYAGTAFFTNMLTTGSFRHLRHLVLPTLHGIGSRKKEAVEQARDNWFRVLKYMCGNGGLDNLRYLCISGSWDNAPVWSFSSDDTATTTTAHIEYFKILRNFIKDYIWPMIDPEYGPPRLPRQLVIGIHSPGLYISRYRIRKKWEQIYGGFEGHLGNLTSSRFISWKPLDHSGLEGDWTHETEDGEWIEEIWIGRND